jgi:GAF domain-containing protein
LGQVIETGEVYWSNNLAAEMVDDATVLPKVNARLIIPLQASGQVLGLLDIQDEQPERFDQNQGNLLRTLADQLAVTLENAILFEGMQLELEELEALNRRLTQSTWHQVTSEVTSSGYVFTPQGIQATNDEWLATMTEAIQLRQLSTLPAPNDPTKIKTATLASTEHSSAAVPLVLRGQVIGVIGVERCENQAWSEDEIVTLQSVSDQVALALDSARLAEETQRRAAREQTIAQLTQRVWASDDIESILRNAVTGLGSTLRASKVVLQLRSAGAKPAPETPDSAVK